METTESSLEPAIRDAQNLLLAKVERRVGLLPGQLVKAFRKYPRHVFVDRYRESGQQHWYQVNPRNLKEHLVNIYRDQPLVIWGETSAVSTISQPSFVLYLLKLMDIRSGEQIFELGAGSGWNAALMGALAKPGEVFSFEIVPELAQKAAERIAACQLKNVHIICGDGMDLSAEQIFDRGIFTAGAVDLPSVFFKCIKNGGRLLFVFQNPGGSDLLLVLNRYQDAFVSSQIIECGFVPVTGTRERKRTAGERSIRPLKDAKGVRILPMGSKVHLESNELLLTREDSQFIWTF